MVRRLSLVRGILAGTSVAPKSSYCATHDLLPRGDQSDPRRAPLDDVRDEEEDAEEEEDEAAGDDLRISSWSTRRCRRCANLNL